MLSMLRGFTCSFVCVIEFRLEKGRNQFGIGFWHHIFDSLNVRQSENVDFHVDG